MFYCFCLFCARVCSECPYKADQSGTMAIVRHSPLLPTIGIPPFGVPLRMDIWQILFAFCLYWNSWQTNIWNILTNLMVVRHDGHCSKPLLFPTIGIPLCTLYGNTQQKYFGKIPFFIIMFKPCPQKIITQFWTAHIFCGFPHLTLALKSSFSHTFFSILSNFIVLLASGQWPAISSGLRS